MRNKKSLLLDQGLGVVYTGWLSNVICNERVGIYEDRVKTVYTQVLVMHSEDTYRLSNFWDN